MVFFDSWIDQISKWISRKTLGTLSFGRNWNHLRFLTNLWFRIIARLWDFWQMCDRDNCSSDVHGRLTLRSIASLSPDFNKTKDASDPVEEMINHFASHWNTNESKRSDFCRIFTLASELWLSAIAHASSWPVNSPIRKNTKINVMRGSLGFKINSEF